MSKEKKFRSNAEVDIQSSTFKEKIQSFLEQLEEDLENTRKNLEFHKLIVSTFALAKVTHPYLEDLNSSIEETEKLLKALEDRKIQGTKLSQFLDGEFVLDFDKFVFLMIDVLGSQMVNYVELKNEFEAVVKLWLIPKNSN